MAVVIDHAHVELDDGVPVARIERILVGGGERVRMIDGVPETTTDPQFESYNVRLLSQAGPMIPDQLESAESYEEACEAGEAYAEKVRANSKKIDDLTEALK